MACLGESSLSLLVVLESLMVQELHSLHFQLLLSLFSSSFSHLSVSSLAESNHRGLMVKGYHELNNRMYQSLYLITF